MNIAVLGTGIMGAPMARNIARAGHDVRAYNRTRAKAEALATDGITVADDPTHAVVGADVLLTMAADADAVIALAEQLPSGDAIWWQAATVGIDGIERCATLAEERGLTLVDAPVGGTKQPAEQGNLQVFASGPDAALDACTPLFDAVGSTTLRLGDTGAGTRFKLVFNHWLLGLVENLAETIAFAEAIDVDARGFVEILAGSPVGAPYVGIKGPAMVDREFDTSFPLALGAKDARLALEAAERHGLELGLMPVVLERFERAIARGHGDDDLAAAIFGSVD
ncbi:NAD(P)-dependent oxidoreductase [Capillimicrobium parvum]|uniref:3-sulfolactaldehyde reductase n=1 Tax=Capillimicrobium parvum TaxID=2884022 RepID=A0A9E6XV75_9ACTN|nr:NAD(P)-dependent oxidoreductase [Capillimicrobium parvum]UGS35021.1 3-sulfolactaldehyde reductase [Capillimicrobium parvum]